VRRAATLVIRMETLDRKATRGRGRAVRGAGNTTRSAPCAGEWVAEEPMEPSPPPSPLLTKQRVVPTSPIMLNNTMNTSSKQTSNMSSKLGNKQTGKQAPGSLVSATESRASSKVSTGAETGSSSMVVMRGLLWVQQDRIFCRWKERFVVLTTHYLQLFRKGRDRLSEMGDFLYKVRLSTLVSVTLEERRGSLTLVLGLKEGRLVMRRTEGIREWQRGLQRLSGGRMERTEGFWAKLESGDTTGEKREEEEDSGLDSLHTSSSKSSLRLSRPPKEETRRNYTKFWARLQPIFSSTGS